MSEINIENIKNVELCDGKINVRTLIHEDIDKLTDKECVALYKHIRKIISENN